MLSPANSFAGFWFCRIRNVFQIAFQTVATAPQESWNSVAVTASAAAALLLDPAARAAQESVEDSQDEALGDGNVGEGPVGRARERWKEAQNEMPEVDSSQAYNQYLDTR